MSFDSLGLKFRNQVPDLGCRQRDNAEIDVVGDVGHGRIGLAAGDVLALGVDQIDSSLVSSGDQVGHQQMTPLLASAQMLYACLM